LHGCNPARRGGGVVEIRKNSHLHIWAAGRSLEFHRCLSLTFFIEAEIWKYLPTCRLEQGVSTRETLHWWAWNSRFPLMYNYNRICTNRTVLFYRIMLIKYCDICAVSRQRLCRYCLENRNNSRNECAYW
jgi:hypothetical protein